MASSWTKIQRAREAFVNVVLQGTPFFAQPMGYLNRHERRALATCKRLGKKPRQQHLANVMRDRELQAAINAKRAALIESEAPT
jgi:hypothetical protein